MNEIIIFFNENLIYILFVVFFIIFLLVLFDILKIDFNIKTKVNLDDDDIQTRTFTVETFDNAFCKVNQNNHIELNKNCNSLDEQGCNSTNCCVYVNHDNKKECMGGNEQGPHFNGTEKNPLNILYFYFKNKCTSVNEKCPE